MSLTSRTAFGVALGLVLASSAEATQPRVAEVSVQGARVHLKDLLDGLPEPLGETDLGPAPAFEGSRFITRADVLVALREQGDSVREVSADGYRVKRKIRTVSQTELATMVREALAGVLPRGAALARVVTAHSTKVPAGWTEVRCEVPHPPHRVGSFMSTATLSFFDGQDALWTMSVPVELSLGDEAVPFDVPRGSHVEVVVRRGSVEVRALGTVTADADVGGMVPVTVLPSGHVVASRVEDARTVVVTEGR